MIAMMIAERKFVINASPEIVWELIGQSIFDALNLERINIIDENRFMALLKVRLGFISLPLFIDGEFVDMSRPEFLSATVKARGMKGVVWLNQKLNITLTPVYEAKTEITCKLMAEGMQILLRLMLLRMVKRTAGDMLDNIKECLEQSV